MDFSSGLYGWAGTEAQLYVGSPTVTFEVEPGQELKSLYLQAGWGFNRTTIFTLYFFIFSKYNKTYNTYRFPLIGFSLCAIKQNGSQMYYASTINIYF